MSGYLELIDHNTRRARGRRCHATPVFASSASGAGLVSDMHLNAATRPLLAQYNCNALEFE